MDLSLSTNRATPTYTGNTSHPKGFQKPFAKQNGEIHPPPKKKAKKTAGLPSLGGGASTTMTTSRQVDRFNPDNQVSLPEAELMVRAGAMAKKAVGGFCWGYLRSPDAGDLVLYVVFAKSLKSLN